VTIKLTGNPEGEGDLHAFFYDGQVKLSAGEPLTYIKRGLTQAESCANALLIFDFGRSPIGSTIVADDIVLMEEK